MCYGQLYKNLLNLVTFDLTAIFVFRLDTPCMRDIDSSRSKHCESESIFLRQGCLVDLRHTLQRSDRSAGWQCAPKTKFNRKL